MKGFYKKGIKFNDCDVKNVLALLCTCQRFKSSNKRIKKGNNCHFISNFFDSLQF